MYVCMYIIYIYVTLYIYIHIVYCIPSIILVISTIGLRESSFKRWIYSLHVPYVHKAKSRHIDQGGLFFPRFQGDLQ